MFIWWTIILILWITALSGFLYLYLADRRACKNPPDHFIWGMAIDTKTKKLVSIRTPVYFDSKTGLQFKGKPDYLK